MGDTFLHRKRAQYVSFFYWVFIFIIPIPSLLAVFYCYTSSKIGYLGLNDDDAFVKEFWGAITLLKENGLAKSLPEDLFTTEFTIPLVGLLSGMYAILQVVLCQKLFSGVEKNNYWNIQSWYDCQFGTLIIYFGFFVGVLGNNSIRIVWPIYHYIFAIGMVTLLSMIWQVFLVYKFMEEIRPEDETNPFPTKRKIPLSGDTHSFFAPNLENGDGVMKTPEEIKEQTKHNRILLGKITIAVFVGLVLYLAIVASISKQ